MSSIEGSRLWGYQGALRRRRRTSAAGSAVQRVPGDRDRLAEQPERHGALDRQLDAVAGLADAGDVFGFLEGEMYCRRLGLQRPGRRSASRSVAVRRSIAMVAACLVFGASASLIACGASDDPAEGRKGLSAPRPKSSAPPPQRTRPQTPQEVQRLPLGLSEKTVLTRLGVPASSPPSEPPKGLECIFYSIAGQPPATAQWRLCFRRGKLELLATYIR